MRPQPLIAVMDVEASSRWYQALLGCKSGYEGKEYGALVKDGELDVHVNPPGHRELWLRDEDGYVVVIASSKGEPR